MKRKRFEGLALLNSWPVQDPFLQSKVCFAVIKRIPMYSAVSTQSTWGFSQLLRNRPCFAEKDLIPASCSAAQDLQTASASFLFKQPLLILSSNTTAQHTKKMNPNPVARTLVSINVDLLVDFYSVYFSTIRFFLMKKYSVRLENKNKQQLELLSLDAGFRNIYTQLTSNNGTTRNESTQVSWTNFDEDYAEVKKLLNNYLPTVKPTIGAFTTVEYLAKEQTTLLLHSFLDEDVSRSLLEIHKDWFPARAINAPDAKTLVEKLRQLSGDQSFGIIDGSVEALKQAASAQDVALVHVKNNAFDQKDDTPQYEASFSNVTNFLGSHRSFEEVPWTKFLSSCQSEAIYPTQEFMLSLGSSPLSRDLKAWGNVITLKTPVKIESQIIHGFGRGGRQLGIPTANLQMTEETEVQLKDLITGVYYGYASFVKPIDGSAAERTDIDFEKQYPMVMSLGFNPYFDNNQKTAEVHVMDKFNDDFYGFSMRIEMIGFIRVEANFKLFDHLIKAIHCDVQVARDLLRTAGASLTPQTHFVSSQKVLIKGNLLVKVNYVNIEYVHILIIRRSGLGILQETPSF
eukprot:TRINITY_DN954_c0_g1_i18.p2 TRINITY_DN954_c0_g1~~TRINITY_DN954_c0_g1_i18.p2  ORF type:complete len:571 (-),score=87.17 TRINITY_DN954_c0_g1_i18:211-1923(-)